METEHSQGVVERAVAFVKDVFGLTSEPKSPDEVAPPLPGPEPKVEFTAEDATTRYPRMNAPKGALELDAESARPGRHMQDEALTR